MLAKVPAGPFEAYLRAERQAGERYLGNMGRVEWLASFAPIAPANLAVYGAPPGTAGYPLNLGSLPLQPARASQPIRRSGNGAVETSDETESVERRHLCRAFGRIGVMRGVDATQRLRAAQASRSPEELTESLGDPSPEVVRAAIDRLVALEGERAAPALRARLLDVDLSRVADIANALRRIGDGEAFGAATAALADRRYSRRLAGVRALAALGDERAAESVRRLLEDDVAGVRAAALDALARLGDVGAGAECGRLLSDPVPHVRIAAVRAVTRVAAHPGALLAAAAEDEDRLVRLEVARHAAELPARSAKALLEDADLRIREAAARAAGTRELGALAMALTDDPAPDVRRASAHTLGAMHDERVADVLVPGLEDRDALVRAAVSHALEELLTRAGAVRRLCDELASERTERRRASVYALARLGARDAAPALSRLADDPDPDVRLALVQTAADLFDDPGPVMRYLATDSDAAVSQGAAMWLLRAARPAR